jgi:endonuclease YncB( thermonuclease family)
MINGALIASGLGRHVNESPNSRYASAFEELEANARASEFGIWDPDNTGA